MSIHISDLTRSNEQILIDLINHDNGTRFIVGDLMFEGPEPITDIVRNTKIKVFGVGEKRAFGETTLTYRRIDIAALPGQFRLWINVKGHSFYRDIIPQINVLLGVNLKENDYVDETLPDIGPTEVGDYFEGELLVTQQNPIFIGKLTLRFFHQ